jgi:hypothetical protein
MKIREAGGVALVVDETNIEAVRVIGVTDV